MATAQTTLEGTQITVDQKGFDLTSMQEVTLRKVGEFTPVETMEQFVSRLGNNAQAILAIVNDGLEKYEEKALVSNTSIPWQLVEEDDETGLETVVPFSGSLISPEKSKALKTTVIGFAKACFNYSKNMVPGNADENRKAKAAAKASALAAILSNPAAVEGLKK